MKAIAFSRTTEMKLLARVATIVDSGSDIRVKWDTFTYVEFRRRGNMLKINKVQVDLNTVYASIYGTSWSEFKDDHRQHVGAALIALGEDSFIIRDQFVVGLVDENQPIAETPVIRNATDYQPAQRTAISGIARNTEDRLARERADTRDAMIHSAGTLLGMGLAAIMSRR